MNLKLLNYLFISLFISFVFAISEDEIAIANSDVTASDLEGDCKDIASLVRGTKILKCLVNDKQKISTLEIFNIKYQTTIDDIGKLTDIENLRVVYESSCFIYTGMYNITSYSPLENLKKLTYYHEDSAIPFHPVSREKYSIILKAKISSLKKLKFNNLVVYDDDIEQIVSQFQNIEELEFEKCLFNHKNNDYEGFKELKHLKILTIGNTTSVGSRLEKIPNVFSLKDLKKLNLPYNTITVIPSDIKNLKNLEYLNLQNNYLEKIPEEISVLTKLEYLNLQRNRIDDIIPESLNKLSNLKYIYLDNNRNIQGKTLINDSLIECKYQSNYSLCKAKDMSCFVKDYKYENCDNTSEIPISTNDQCGKEYGRCPSGDGSMPETLNK